MTESEKRKHRCCFAGHRPEKITFPISDVCDSLKEEIQQAIYDGLTVFITGMARGVDIWAAEIVLQLREQGQDIKLICAVPYRGYERNWKLEWQTRYNTIISHADLVRFISPKYSRNCFQIRNKLMVDHSARVIAVFNGEKSGTKNTIDYAQKNHVPVMFINK